MSISLLLVFFSLIGISARQTNASGEKERREKKEERNTLKWKRKLNGEKEKDCKNGIHFIMLGNFVHPTLVKLIWKQFLCQQKRWNGKKWEANGTMVCYPLFLFSSCIFCSSPNQMMDDFYIFNGSVFKAIHIAFEMVERKNGKHKSQSRRRIEMKIWKWCAMSFHLRIEKGKKWKRKEAEEEEEKRNYLKNIIIIVTEIKSYAMWVDWFI